MEMRLGYWLDISHLPSRHWLQDRGELEFRAGIFCHLLGLSKLLGLLWIFSNFTTAPGFFFFDDAENRTWLCGLVCFSGYKVCMSASMREWELGKFPIDSWRGGLKVWRC